MVESCTDFVASKRTIALLAVKATSQRLERQMHADNAASGCMQRAGGFVLQPSGEKAEEGGAAAAEP